MSSRGIMLILSLRRRLRGRQMWRLRRMFCCIRGGSVGGGDVVEKSGIMPAFVRWERRRKM